MKILLIGINARYTHTNLAIRRLYAAAKDLDIEIRLAEFSINMEAESIAEAILKEKADAVGFSVYIWNSEITKRIIKLIKQSGTRLFAGGPEASFSPEDFLPFAEHILYGEGENSFVEYIRFLKGERRISQVPSLYYMEGELLKKTAPAKAVDLDEMGEPYALSDEETNMHRVVYYESSRGCPFRCAYCLSGAEKALRFRSAEKTIADMKLYAKKGVKHIKFVDRTFNADKERAKKIWRSIAQMDCDSEFHFEIAAELLDEESVEIINTAPKKRIRLEIGVQSTNEKTLLAIDRANGTDKIFRMTELLRKGNANLHLDLIAGLPFEGKERFIRSLDESLAVGADEVQLGFLKLLKGSTLYEKASSFGIIFGSEAPYEVIRTSWLSEKELDELKRIEYALSRLYNSGLFRNTLRLIAMHFNEGYSKGVFPGSYGKALLEIDSFAGDMKALGEKAMAEMLLSFGERFKIEHIRNALRYDMIKKERRTYLPDVLEDGAKPEKKAYYLKNPSLPGLKKGKRPWNYSRLEHFSLDMRLFEEKGEICQREHYLFFDYINSTIYEVEMEKM